MNVHIKDAHLVAKLGHGAGDIDSDGALADAAFAAHDENLVLDVGEVAAISLSCWAMSSLGQVPDPLEWQEPAEPQVEQFDICFSPASFPLQEEEHCF